MLKILFSLLEVVCKPGRYKMQLRARIEYETPERFFTKTLAVAKSTISLLNSCAIRAVEVEGSAEGEAEGSPS